MRSQSSSRIIASPTLRNDQRAEPILVETMDASGGRETSVLALARNASTYKLDLILGDVVLDLILGDVVFTLLFCEGDFSEKSSKRPSWTTGTPPGALVLTKLIK